MGLNDKDFTKSIYCPNLNDWEKLLERNLVHSSHLDIIEVADGYILPPRLRLKTTSHNIYEGGVIDNNLHFVAGLQRSKKNTAANTLHGSYDFNKNDVTCIDDEIIFGGVIIKQFGHILVDTISRLWYVINNSDRSRKIVFICFSDITASMNLFRPFLGLLNIDESRIILCETVTKFKKIIVPEQSIHSFWYVNTTVLNIYDFLVENSVKQYNKKYSSSQLNKLYLTRSAYTKGKNLSCLGEDYFERFYSQEGYHIISPEKYPVSEQIYLMANADKVVTTLGTLSHFIIFAKSNSSFSILNRSHDTLLPQAILLKLMEERQIKYEIIDVSMNYIFGMRNLSICLLGPSYYWKKYLQDKGIEFEYDDNFKSWLINLYNYFELFFKHYSQSKFYEFIKNLSIADVMSSISEIIYGKKFQKPVLQNDLESDNRRLPLINEVLRKRLELLTINSLQCCSYSLGVKLHLSHIGWSELAFDSDISNINYSEEQIESIILYLISLTDNEYIPFRYKVYIKNIGWSEFVSNGNPAGSTGNSAPIQSICIDKNSLPQYISVYYRVFGTSKSWSRWVAPDDCIDVSENRKIYAIDFKIEYNI